ncbi:MAG: M23 family metallopeptidase [Patescibacteria group bacterium]
MGRDWSRLANIYWLGQKQIRASRSISIKYKFISFVEDRLTYLRGKWLLVSGWPLSRKLLGVVAFFVVFGVVFGVFWAEDDSAVLDSVSTEIVEEIDTSDSGFLKSVLSKESSAASVMLFASNLENRLSEVLNPRAKRSLSPFGGPDEFNDFNQLESVGSALVAQGPVLAIIPAAGYLELEDGDVLTYEVEEGDSLKSIAEDFGISVDTLLNANNLPLSTKLKPGDKISILPVDGVRHTVKSGDTIKSIALKYKADEDRILAFNGLDDNGKISVGQVLIIPGGEFHVPISPKVAPARLPLPQNLPNIGGYYGKPSGGRRTFGLHRYNAIDIGGKEWCNTPLYASAAGTIITADAQGWNGGYGRYIKISHDNGTITLYAHSSQLLVFEGQSVAKGQTIGLMGSTGRSTGCHVHFEVRGAKNPFVN